MDKVMMIDFPSIAFQSSLATEAILFGVFGFLYAVFGAYSAQATPKSPRPPIVKDLKWVCRIIALVISFNAAITVYSLFALNIFSIGWGNVFLGGGLALIMVFIAGFSLIWGFKYLA